ncbi:MAG: SUMF1/EgtB/PvdO family nonheme iron enzyme [Opitutales bacterium]|nr:SUMF1/EgtB/PvdO family nonheme iron enzyme [Opitutales bacterium]
MAKRSSVDYYARKQFRKKLLGVSAIVFALALFAGGLYVLTLLGPRPVADEETVRRGDPAEVAPLRSELEVIAARIDEAVDSGEIDEAVLEDVERAVDLQRRIITLEALTVPRNEDSQRLDSLRSLRDEHFGERLYAASVEAEEAAESAYERGDTEATVAYYKEAVRLQEEINMRHARSPRRSTGRLTALRDTLVDMEVLPLVEEIEEFAERARALADEGDIEGAKEAMRRAVEGQQRLNREHRDTRYASLGHVQDLEREMSDFEARGFAADVEEMVAMGREHLAEDNFDAAHRRFREAHDRQRTLNESFPASTYASRRAEEDLIVLVQTAASAESARRVTRAQAQVDADLRSRRVNSASSQAPAVFRDVRALHENFPRSQLVSEEMLLKARYLNSMREDFSAIQDSVYARLVEIPDYPHLRMLSVEVPQGLYARVMGSNPSTRRGDQLPVETVTQREAMEFCDRLGWILARPVRLPSRDEFEAAVGSMRGVDVDRIAWNSQNSDRETQPVGTREMNDHGFHDLLGNVAEWTGETNPVDPSEGIVVGGSVRDNPLRLNRMPVEYHGRNDRTRIIGFRFVVDMETTPRPIVDEAAVFAADDDA